MAALLMALSAPGQGADATETEGGSVTTLLGERLRAHIEFLSDDLLEGRQPGTPGYDLAAAYVASQFRQAGLAPAGGAGSFLQSVPLRRAWLEKDAAELTLLRGDSRRSFAFVEEYYRGPDLAHPASETRAQMAFVAYGVHAPQLDYSDYGRMSVEGKVAVMLAGHPAHFPGEEGAHFGSGREKVRAALEHGAVGVIRVYTPRNARRFNWSRVRTRVGMPAMGWLDGAGEVPAAPPGLRGEAFLHYDAAGALFEGSGHTITELLALDQAGEPLPVFELTGQVEMAQRSRHEVMASANVAGLAPGSDPLLADEVVIYTAHLDHLGRLPGAGHEDPIHNGALDNAAGVAVMIETARMMTRGETPRRSVLFLAVTAEEKGLVGSGYYAQNPTVPIERIVGVVNLDMPLLLYEFGDVIAFGAEHSSLGAAARRAAAELDTALTPDPFPDLSIFVRSDHYRFVQQGVPALYLITGITARDGRTQVMPVFQDFLDNHYHRPSDDIRLPIDYAAAERFTRINHRIGEIIANDPQRPRWNQGDFFGEAFGK